MDSMEQSVTPAPELTLVRPVPPLTPRIQAAREKFRGHARSVIARLAGISASYVIKIEQGRAVPTDATAQRIADALDRLGC